MNKMDLVDAQTILPSQGSKVLISGEYIIEPPSAGL